MNKKNVLFLTFIFFAYSLFCVPTAAKTPVSFSIKPELGFIYGTIYENVWRADTTISGNQTISTPASKESQLDWQLQNAMYTGADINLIFSKHFSVDFDFKTAFAGIAGIMEDYDWLNPENWPGEPEDELTNYSYHENYLSNFSQIKFLFGYTFILNPDFDLTITPKLGFETQRFYFSGNGGYKTYKSEGWEPITFGKNTPVIKYSQAFLAPYAGVSVHTDFLKYFAADLSLGLLYADHIDAYDDHILKHNTGRACYFNDRLENVFIFDAALELLFKLSQHNRIGFKGTIQVCPKVYGFTFYSRTSFKDLSDIPFSSELGGSSRLLFSYALVYQFKF